MAGIDRSRKLLEKRPTSAMYLKDLSGFSRKSSTSHQRLFFRSTDFGDQHRKTCSRVCVNRGLHSLTAGLLGEAHSESESRVGAWVRCIRCHSHHP